MRCTEVVTEAQAEAYATQGETEGKGAGRRLAVRKAGLGVIEPGGLDFGRVLESLHYYAELFGFFL